MNSKLNRVVTGVAGALAMAVIAGCGEAAAPSGPTVVKKEVKVDEDSKKVKTETETKNPDGTTTKTKEETKTETK